MAANLASDKFWVNKNTYHDAEKKYHENLSKLQRRLEILGGKNEETNKKNNTKNNKKYKKMCNGVNIDELRKQLLNLEAQENAKNKIFHSETQSLEVIREKEDYNQKKRQMREQQKENREKKNKSDEKPNRTKENEDDLLGGVGVAKINQDAFPKTSLAGEVAKARQHIKSSLECMENMNGMGNLTNPRLAAVLENLEKVIENLTRRVEALERESSCKRHAAPVAAVCPTKSQVHTSDTKHPAKDVEDDDVDIRM